jgi:hypothetical protein
MSIDPPPQGAAGGSVPDDGVPPPMTTRVTPTAAVTTMVGGATGTTVVGDPTVDLAHVPPEVFARFPGCTMSAGAGAEAVVLTGDDPTFGAVAVKVYRRGTVPNQAIIATLQRADPAHVARLHVAESIGGCWVEVLERIDGGTLGDLAAANRPDDALLRTVLRELTDAIAHFHQLELIHRDIKPANVLVRELDPLDLVLVDFGLAAISTDDVDIRAQDRTIHYSSPETHMGLRSPQGDWWSLGIIMAELLMGRHPFEGYTDAEIVNEIAARDVKLDGIDDDRWRMLCEGLLTRDADERWWSEQIDAWMDGGSPPVVRHTALRNPFVFQGEDFDSRRSLLAAMSQDWDGAVQAVAGPNAYQTLCTWLLQTDPGNSELGVTLDAIGAVTDPEARLFTLLRRLQPDLAAVFRTYALGGDGVSLLAAAAVVDGPASAPAQAVQKLFDASLLAELDEEGVALDREWRSTVDSSCDLINNHGSTDDEQRSIIRARVLLCLTDQDARQSVLDRASGLSRSAAAAAVWFRTIARSGATSLPAAVAALALEPTALTEVRAGEAADRARHDAAVRMARAETSRRYPTTRRRLGMVLVVIGLLAAAVIATRYVKVPDPDLPSDQSVTIAQLITRDPLAGLTSAPSATREAYIWFQPSLLRLANPVYPVVILIVGLVLFVRGKGVGTPGSTRTRSEWERRGMQGTIIAACLYFPLIAPFALYSLYRSLYADKDRGAADDNVVFRRVVNVAGVGFALHGLSLVMLRSGQLSEWFLSFPSWHADVIERVPNQLLTTVMSPSSFGWMITISVVTAIVCWYLAAQSLHELELWERITGWVMTPIGLLALIPGVLYAGFLPLTYAGLAVVIVVGAALALVIGFGLLGLFLSSS